jgi:acetate kinase
VAAAGEDGSALRRGVVTPPPRDHVLTLNGGSSSLKFAVFRVGDALTRVLSGRFERIGLDPFLLVGAPDAPSARRPVAVRDLAGCAEPLVELLRQRGLDASLRVIGHRVVHGGERYRQPERVSEAMLAELRRLRPFDPEHMPGEIALLKEFSRRFAEVPHVACFDTGFHRHMPRVATLLPIPRRYDSQGVRRYGFHGLSYAYLMEELERLAGADAARGRIVLAHLGNGASMAAVRDGRCIDTTMAFTPTAGLVMGTRSGDLDPGLVAYLARTEGMSTEQFHLMVNKESGLLGLSELSSDVRDLLEREEAEPRAAEALAVFCYQARKWIGALAAALGGLDTLVFSAGIGEHAAPVRARICTGLEFLGVELDAARNDGSAAIISADGARVAVRVIPTDEERQIAEASLLAVRH